MAENKYCEDEFCPFNLFNSCVSFTCFKEYEESLNSTTEEEQHDSEITGSIEES